MLVRSLLRERCGHLVRDDPVRGARGVDAVPEKMLVGLLAVKRRSERRDARARHVREPELLALGDDLVHLAEGVEARDFEGNELTLDLRAEPESLALTALL